MCVLSQDQRSGAKPDRNLALELVRVTEAAALAAARWVGRGEKESADGAAVDAMRVLLDTVPMDGLVVIGEGEKDEAPMLYNGERIGDGSPPEVDIAVDPLEGTTLTARGMPSALSVIALAERGTMFDPGPCVYMEKIAGNSEIADVLSLDEPLTDVIGEGRRAQGQGRRRRHGDHARPPAPRGQGGRDPRGRRAHPLHLRRRRLGRAVRRLRRRRRRPALGDRRYAGGRASPPRRSSASAASFSASSGRATTRSARLRSTPATTSTRPSTSTASSPARTCSSRPRGHRRRAAPGSALQPRQGDHGVARDALALRHRAHRLGPSRPGEAPRGDRRQIRVDTAR